jgi:hypothetical protein
VLAGLTGTSVAAAQAMAQRSDEDIAKLSLLTPRLCENAREQRMRRIVFFLFLFRLWLPVLFFSYST